MSSPKKYSMSDDRELGLPGLAANFFTAGAE